MSLDSFFGDAVQRIEHPFYELNGSGSNRGDWAGLEAVL